MTPTVTIEPVRERKVTIEISETAAKTLRGFIGNANLYQIEDSARCTREESTALRDLYVPLNRALQL